MLAGLPVAVVSKLPDPALCSIYGTPHRRTPSALRRIKQNGRGSKGKKNAAFRAYICPTGLVSAASICMQISLFFGVFGRHVYPPGTQTRASKMSYTRQPPEFQHQSYLRGKAPQQKCSKTTEKLLHQCLLSPYISMACLHRLKAQRVNTTHKRTGELFE